MLRTALVACLLAVLVGAPAALGHRTRTKILQECQDGRQTGDYTPRQIRDALNNIPDDVDQYSDCRDVLRGALLSQAGNSGSGGGGHRGLGGRGGGRGAGRARRGGRGGGVRRAGRGGAPLPASPAAPPNALERAAAGGSQPVQIAGR